MKRKLGGLLYCLLQIVVGVLLLFDPVRFASGIIMAIGVVLTLLGLVGVIKYFRNPVEEAAKSQALTKALLMVLVGLFCAFGTDWLIVTFPIITILYGVMMLVVGISKIQFVVDTIRRKEKSWFLGLISAVITLACAGVVILNPFSSTAVLWMFTGISITVDALFDIVALFLVKGAKKEATE